MAKKPALGKGLGSLITIQSQSGAEAVTSSSPESFADQGERVLQLDHNSIVSSPLQPRIEFSQEQLDDLVKSIQEHGIIQPLIVRKVGAKYELIAGERRWRAAAHLNMATVPVIVRSANDQEVLEMALIENLQRENLNPLEEAQGYLRLRQDFNLKQEEIAQKVGKSRATVANSIRLIDLCDDAKNLLALGDISVGHAKVLLALKDASMQSRLAHDIVDRSLTVRQTEAAVFKLLNPEPPKDKKAQVFQKASEILSRQFDTPVKIRAKAGNKGSVEITYSNKSDLIRIMKLIGAPVSSRHLDD